MPTPSFNTAINNLSFGNVSIGILREVFKRGLAPNVFPIGNVDLSTQKPDDDFNRRLSTAIETAPRTHSRDDAVIRLWHLNGSLESYSRRDSRLITFFELDGLTPTETNILRQQDKVYVTSSFTQRVFEDHGIQSIYLPLGFDAHNFHQLDKRPLQDGITTFCLGGKLEKRKGHLKVLNLWAKKYGNNPKYRLNAALHNPFMKPEHVNAFIGQALEGKQYFNINFLPYMGTNAEYNSFLQSGQIYLAMSGGEGRGLPEYHATALGAWPVALNAHAYKDYFTTDNAVLVNPNGKVPAADGVFFGTSGPYNIGNLFDFDGDQFVAACEEAERRAAQGLNTKGLELQKLTYKDTVDVLLKDFV
jgi:hypothetical protein